VSEPGKRIHDDGIEALLRESLESAPPPELPPTFTERVTARLRPRRLDASAKRTLRLYTLAAAALSLGVMAMLGVPWSLIALALAVPAAIGYALRNRLR
jgi:anti-sigma factor RsiW